MIIDRRDPIERDLFVYYYSTTVIGIVFKVLPTCRSGYDVALLVADASSLWTVGDLSLHAGVLWTPSAQALWSPDSGDLCLIRQLVRGHFRNFIGQYHLGRALHYVITVNCTFTTRIEYLHIRLTREGEGATRLGKVLTDSWALCTGDILLK